MAARTKNRPASRGPKSARTLTPLAERLIEARRSLGLSQKELADRLAVGWRSIQEYEQARATPGGSVLAAYGTLGVDLNWLIVGEGASPTGAEVSTDDDPLVRLPHFDPSEVDADFTESAARSTVVEIRRSWLDHHVRPASGADADVRLLATTLVADTGGDPELPQGSVVLFDPATTEIDSDGPYLFRFAKRLSVRWVRERLDGAMHVGRTSSTSESDRRERRSVAESRLAGRVVAVLKSTGH